MCSQVFDLRAVLITWAPLISGITTQLTLTTIPASTALSSPIVWFSMSVSAALFPSDNAAAFADNGLDLSHY